MSDIRSRTLPQLLVTCLLMMACSPAMAVEVGGDRILGTWAVPEKPAVVSMVKTATGYQGSVIRNDPKPEMVGKPIFRDLQFDAKTAKWTGSVYAMERKEWREVEISMPSDSAFNMTVHVGLFSKTLEWHRIPSTDATH